MDCSRKCKKKQEENKLTEIVSNASLCVEMGSCCMAVFQAETKQIVDNLDSRFIHLNDISRKISEIHTLHFPKDALEEKSNLTEKFLADIILGHPKNGKR